MTIKELSRLYYLNREIAQYQNRLDALMAKATRNTFTIDGMPRVPGIADALGKYVAEMADLQRSMELAVQQSFWERDRLLEYINSISDLLTRQIFMLRFHDGMSYQEVADSIGGGNTPGSVKQRIFREIRKSSPSVTP